MFFWLNRDGRLLYGDEYYFMKRIWGSIKIDELELKF